MASIIDCIKKGDFKWTNSAAKAFEEMKSRMTKALVICFSKVFEVACDALGVGMVEY